MMFANCLKKISQRSLGAVSDFQFQSSAYIFGLTYLAYQINKKNYGTSWQWQLLTDSFMWKMTSHRPSMESVTVTIFSQFIWRMMNFFIDCITTIQRTRCDGFTQTE